MTKNDGSSILKRLRSQIMRELLLSGAYNPANQFVNIDEIWKNPAQNKKVSKLIAKYLSLCIPIDQVTGIISVDSVIYPYGPIPFAVHLSTLLGLPLTIWKENDDPIIGSHKLYGASAKDNCLLFYDVTRFGLTALRLIGFLQANGIHPKWFVSILDCEQGAREFIQKEVHERMGFEIEIISILSLTEISEKYTAGKKGGNTGHAN